MRIHILTSCTGEKIANPKNQLTQSDFANPNVFSYREGELADYIEEAQCMYTGQQHVRLMRYIEDLQGQLEVELSIVSAGYGLISGSQRIAPYECTFQGVAVEDTSLPYFADADLDDDVDLDDPFLTFLGVDYSDLSEDDDDYDDYDDQQRYDDAVADDLFWTFLGADDEMRYREDSE